MIKNKVSLRFPLNSRRQNGMTLTEVLVGTLLMGFTMAVLAEFMAGVLFASTKLTNQFEGQSELRNAMSRMRFDVRSARNFGDSYSSRPSIYFPETGNWLYSSTPPTGGWPSEWGPTPYRLDGQTLIMQIPATLPETSGVLAGVPLKIAKGQAVNGVSTESEMDDLDTVIYKVVPDQTDNTIYSLQVATFPGASNQNKIINPPQTLIHGITGPKINAGSSVPEVFRYLSENGSGGINLQTSPTELLSATGVRVDIEVRRPIKSATAGKQKNSSAHLEVFTRLNR